MTDEVLALALRVAALGWHVHPTYATGPKAKQPRTRGWPTAATTDPRKVTNWYESFRGEPEGCAFGVACGAASGVFVVDVDTDGAPANDAWDALVAVNDPLPATTVARTGSGGVHLYFKYPKGDVVGNSRSSVAKKVDVRGDGGHIVLPPSPHPSGQAYEWLAAPWEVPPAEAPAWLLKLVTKKTQKRYKDVAEVWEPGEQEETLFHHGHEWGMTGGSLDVITNVVLTKWKDGSIPNKEGAEPWTEEALKAKVKRGWETGVAARESISTGVIAPPASPPPPPSGDDVSGIHSIPDRFVAPLGITDADNGIRFARLHANNALYVEGMGWHIWDGARWMEDREFLQVMRLADRVGRHILTEAANLTGGDRQTLARHGVNSLSRGRLEATVWAGRKYLNVHPDKLDANPWLLNFKNGTVDLRVGELRPHRRVDLISKVIDAEFDMAAECPTWEQTLGYAFGDDVELRGYFQRAVGYSLTGVTGEQAIFICWGPAGRNGKSTLISALHRALGRDYAASVNTEVFLTDGVGNFALSTLAQLKGVRFVDMSEASGGMALNEELIKVLTGGDPVSAKRMYQDKMEFYPQFKAWILTNEKPIIRGTEDPTWRRIKLLPFELQVPADKVRARQVVDVALDAERAGILAWAVRGCSDWQAREALGEPEVVTQAVKDYQGEMDIVGDFMVDCMEPTTVGGKGATTKDAYKAFNVWCKENGIKYVFTAKRFTVRLSKRATIEEDSAGHLRRCVGWKLNEDGLAMSEGRFA